MVAIERVKSAWKVNSNTLEGAKIVMFRKTIVTRSAYKNLINLELRKTHVTSNLNYVSS